MVSEKVLIKDKFRKAKKISIIFLIIIGIAVILAVSFFSGFFSNDKQEIIVEHPLKNIVFSHTNQAGIVDKSAVIQEAVIKFNEDYINYILLSLGINKLHKSSLGYGNPKVEFVLGDETWSTEVIKNQLYTKKQTLEKKDIIIKTTKENIIEILLSENIEQSLKDAVISGKIKLEQTTGKVELASKGYLSLYTELTGESIT